MAPRRIIFISWIGAGVCSPSSQATADEQRDQLQIRKGLMKRKSPNIHQMSVENKDIETQMSITKLCTCILVTISSKDT